MFAADAPAKVNLFLGVGSLRPDGYHAVRTVLHAVELCDRVTLRPSDQLRVTCSDVGVPPEQNLAYAAARRMAEAFGIAPDVSLRIEKRIPHGAGLGGGSSDAAAVVALLARHWGAEPSSARCMDVAASLGADVPFFLTSTGAAFMTGRGDTVERLLSATDCPVVLVMPPDRVSTESAYQAFDADPQPEGSPDGVIDALERADAELLASSAHNNMERASMSVAPVVSDALAWLRGKPGIRSALVAGSGSTVCGLCVDEEAAGLVADAAMARGWWAASTRLRKCGVRVIGEAQ